MEHTVKCKYCSEVYEYTQYNDERGMIERHQSCPRCGHTANFAYGTGLDNTAWYEDALKYRSQKNEWISVEDRLPEAGETVLICLKKIVVEHIDGNLPVQQAFVGKNYMFGCVHYTYDLGHITHWLPLPEPPKE